MRILDSYMETAGAALILGTIILAACGVVAGVLFVISFIDAEWGWVITWGVVFFLAVLGMVGNISNIKKETFRIKVIMEEKVDLYELLDKYEITERNGEILTLTPIDKGE